MAQQLKNLPAMQAAQAMVQSLGRKASLEEEMVTHSNILAWKIPLKVGPGGLQSMGLQKVRYN